MLFIIFVVIAVAALASSSITSQASYGASRALVPLIYMLTAVFAGIAAAITALLVPSMLMGDPTNPTTSTETFALQALYSNPGGTPAYTATAAQGASKGEIDFVYDDHGTMRQATSAPNLVSVVEDGGQPRVEVRHTKVSHILLTPFERDGYDQYILHVPAGSTGSTPKN